MHIDLSAAIEFVYSPSALECCGISMEPESAEYGAYAFQLAGRTIRFRAAKTTPTKIGQFVTLWKRSEDGPIQPFDLSDPVDFFVVSCRRGERWGQFIFPKTLLCERDVVSRDGRGGKRAMRVYPPWDTPTSRQALQTQNWQLDHFLDTSDGRPIDRSRVRASFGLKA